MAVKKKGNLNIATHKGKEVGEQRARRSAQTISDAHTLASSNKSKPGRKR